MSNTQDDLTSNLLQNVSKIHSQVRWGDRFCWENTSKASKKLTGIVRMVNIQPFSVKCCSQDREHFSDFHRSLQFFAKILDKVAEIEDDAKCYDVASDVYGKNIR
ncbi:hypothetical protein HOLleu_29207 [Holothuria leucospilota]|uniref:Uncharacterized protein n=1 Tax=Holothuria leucospilota TaxID=206669 RepID=A0A9Q1BN50_HOLLE|nr:hypothetical protein HOLleu_29207 [Holothuria leucospilota]